TAWVSRRTERSRPATLFAAAATGLALLLVLPVCLDLIVGGQQTPQGQPERPFWAPADRRPRPDEHRRDPGRGGPRRGRLARPTPPGAGPAGPAGPAGG